MNSDLGDEMREPEERPAHPATPLQRAAYLLSGWMLLILPAAAVGVMGLSLAWNAPQPEETMRAVEQRVKQLGTVEEVSARHAEGDMWGSPRMELYIAG